MPRDEIGVARHPRDFALVEQWNRLHEFSQVVVADLVGERVIAFGIDPLADQHLQPADLGEQFFMLANDLSVFRESSAELREGKEWSRTCRSRWSVAQ